MAQADAKDLKLRPLVILYSATFFLCCILHREREVEDGRMGEKCMGGSRILYGGS